MTKPSLLIGKKVLISNKESWDFGLWGEVLAFDGEHYHIAIQNNRNSVHVFDRDEFVVPRPRRPQRKRK